MVGNIHVHHYPGKNFLKWKTLTKWDFSNYILLKKKINNSEIINYTFESKSAQEIVKLSAMNLYLRYNSLCLSNQQFY